MNRGLSKASEIREEIVKSSDGKTATRYRVVEEVIDLDRLRREKANLEAELEQAEPSEAELIDMGKVMHPYYTRDTSSIQKKIDELDSLLKE
jgi:hypothetical protein